MKKLAFLFLIGQVLTAQTIYKSTDYANLSSVPATSGDVIEVYGEFDNGTGNIPSNIYIVGKTPNASIIGGGISSTQAAINCDNDTVFIRDVYIRSRIAIHADDYSHVELENVTILPHDDIIDQSNEYASRDGGLVHIIDSKLVAKNCDVINSANQGSYWQFESSTIDWQGDLFDVDAMRSAGNCRIDIDVKKAIGIYGAGQHNRWRFGEENPYNSSILGSKNNVLDTLPQNYLDHNAGQNGHVKISIEDGRYLWSGIVACGNYTMQIENSMFAGKVPDENGEMPSMTGIEFENNATVKLTNVVTARIDAKYFHGYFESDPQTQIYYDRDLVVDEEKQYYGLYNSGNFPYTYGQGTHGVEGSDLWNLAAIPTYRFDDTQIIYMGDDVLNKLPVEQALKELSVNPLFRSDTEDYPSDTGLNDAPNYTESTTYNQGDTMFLGTTLFIATQNFTSVNSNQDHADNKIRALVGCKKFGKYYGTLLYEKNRGWINVFTLGQWHGGYCRNRGNAVAFYNGNVIGSIRLVEHNSTWTWFASQNPTVKYWDKEGKNGYYRNIITTKFGDYWNVQKLHITQVGITEDYAKKSALQIDLQDGIPNQTIRIQDLRIHSDGLTSPVELVGVDVNGHSVYIGTMEVVGMPDSLNLPDFGVFGGAAWLS